MESKIPYCVIGFSEKLPEAVGEDTILSGIQRCCKKVSRILTFSRLPQSEKSKGSGWRLSSEAVSTTEGVKTTGKRAARKSRHVECTEHVKAHP